MGLESAADVTHRKRAEDLGDFEKVGLLSSASGEVGWLLLARQSQANGLVVGTTPVGGGGGADGNVIIERLWTSSLCWNL